MTDRFHHNEIEQNDGNISEDEQSTTHRVLSIILTYIDALNNRFINTFFQDASLLFSALAFSY